MSRFVLCLFLVGCASAGDPDAVPVDAPPGGNPDGQPEIPDGPMNSACDNKLGMLGTDFENGTAGWSHVVLDGAEGEASWPFDEWQHGAASTVGPTMCHQGSGCWATHLTKNYTSCERAALISPTFDLSSCAGRDVKLTFWSWHSFWTGSYGGTTWYDGGLVEISTNGSSWTAVTPTPAYPGTIDINPHMTSSYECVLRNSFYVDGKQGFVGNGNGWKLVTISVPATMLTATFQIRFAYGSGVSHQSTNAETNRGFTAPGWYIDELAFSAL
jgi:hypothetical protein